MQEAGELKALVHDNASGAREIAERSLALLQKSITQSPAVVPGELLDEVADLSVKIIRSKPEMATVFQTLDAALLEAEALEPSATELGPFRMELLALLQRHVAAVKGRVTAIAQHARPLVENGSVLLTYSRSSTVLQTLRAAKQEGRLFDVLVTESRPNLEGRTLARELAEDQIPVRLVVDALVGTALEGADRVLLGADAITPDALVNKVGTRLLLIAAREAGVPVTVLAESTKFWAKKADPALGLLAGRSRDPREVWDNPPRGVEVVNLYFERAPLSLTQNVVDEEGIHDPLTYWQKRRARGHARRLEEAFPGELL